MTMAGAPRGPMDAPVAADGAAGPGLEAHPDPALPPYRQLPSYRDSKRSIRPSDVTDCTHCRVRLFHQVA